MSTPQTFAHDTWISPESDAYPHGGMTRKGAALFPDGKLRAIRAGIPDTMFSIPASARVSGKYVAGFVTIDDGLLECPHPHPDHALHCEECQFGLIDSPTRGALIFHPNA